MAFTPVGPTCEIYWVNVFTGLVRVLHRRVKSKSKAARPAATMWRLLRHMPRACDTPYCT